MARVRVDGYQSLVKEFGEEKAKLIVRAIGDVNDLATKRDLLELKVELIRWNVGTMVAMTGIFALLLKLFGEILRAIFSHRRGPMYYGYHSKTLSHFKAARA